LSALEELACRQYADSVTAYLEGELTEDRAGPFEQHNLVCEGCSRYLEQMRATVRLLSDRDESAPRGRTDRVPTLTGDYAYKFLSSGRIGPFSRFEWPEDTWVTATGPPRACFRGIHACRAEDLPYWLGEELWRVELAEPVLQHSEKVVAAGGRLRERVTGWTAELAASFAVYSAERARERALDGLRQAGLTDDAKLVEATSDEELPGLLEELFERAGPARAACEYAGAAAESLAAPPFEAAAGAAYSVALAAAHAAGVSGRLDERRDQAAWLGRELGLNDSL
jgi:hypothetical protein